MTLVTVSAVALMSVQPASAHFGTYKLSLHLGSDKFSVYPPVTKHWGSRVHVKTAGTNFLEALRVLAQHEPDLFRRILDLARAVSASMDAILEEK